MGLSTFTIFVCRVSKIVPWNIQRTLSGGGEEPKKTGKYGDASSDSWDLSKNHADLYTIWL